MNRKSVFIAATLLIAGLAGEAAQAKRWGCWIQADRNVRIRNTASNASQAVSDWNNLTILNLSSVSSGEETYVFNANSGNTGWGGLASITNYSGCTILRATAQLNTYYSWTANAARGVHCQEVGHTFGLDHSNDGGCMGGGYWYDIGTHYQIVQGNINEIGSMYANRVAGSSMESVNEGHEEEGGTPRFHAFWYHHPRTLRQATRQASDVVIARVTSISEGDAIETAYPDGSGVQRIPTQRVSFEVTSSRKGSLGVNESFVLFQNGNEENRFDEDPSYKVGKAYLLFLTPREDGTYLVLSPEGRYEVTKKGLVPAAQKGFAKDLAGAKLQDVISDVTRAVAAADEQE
ncbi:MAG TPA: hypothetical protein VNM67_12320 [Thermoanaerobaculia bacterium]|jgi:hypothetical protein|nr:hypothetical protein [Thermoanaerobaculia bacterium]